MGHGQSLAHANPPCVVFQDRKTPAACCLPATCLTEYLKPAVSCRPSAFAYAHGQVADPVTGAPLRVRVGINSGSVMSGIVGSCRARYCLFGGCGLPMRGRVG